MPLRFCASSSSSRLLAAIVNSALLAGCATNSALAPVTGRLGTVPLARSGALSAAAKSFTTLYSFGGLPDGQDPSAGLLADKNGDLFGTTSLGGANGAGTVFELKHAGNAYHESVVYTFGSASDGQNPVGNLIANNNGGLFVTAQNGGQFAAGAAAELVPSGGIYLEKRLYSFGSGTDGSEPQAAFLEQSGTLYGTTSYGGTHENGTIVALTATGFKEKVVYDFGNALDGMGPASTLVADSSGALYGTTEYGGATGSGTIFKFVPSANGGAETILINLQGDIGAFPVAGLVRGGSGALYGTTTSGGANGLGVVFKVTVAAQSQTLTVLHSFAGAPDGRRPAGSLVLKDNTLYGTTGSGGTGTCSYEAGGCGTIFKLSISGANYSVIHSFGGTDGADPVGDLLSIGPALYGTTGTGGTNLAGTVFRIEP